MSQFLLLDDDLLTYLYEQASTSGQKVLSTESVARDLLTTAIQSFEKLYVVLDGLDECDRDERKHIVSFFDDTWKALPQKDQDSLRCLFLSQSDNIARKDHANMSTLKISEENTRKDIRAYAGARSLEIKKRFALSADQQSMVEDKIVEMAEGKFEE